MLVNCINILFSEIKHDISKFLKFLLEHVFKEFFKTVSLLHFKAYLLALFRVKNRIL